MKIPCLVSTLGLLALPGLLALLAPLAILAGCRPAASAPAAPEPTRAPTPAGPVTAVVHGILIDGTGAEPVPDAVVLIQDGRILAAGPAADIAVPDGAEIIDAAGGTVLPGFINAHVHDGFDADNLRAWAAGGVTTVRDEGARPGRSLKELMDWRASIADDPQYARLVSAGFIISVPDGYGQLAVSSPAEARQKVNEELDLGVENIKLSQENGYAGVSGLPRLDEETMRAIVEAAHARGARVSGHITQARYLDLIVAAGVDDAAHVAYDPISDETIATMVAEDIYLIPTFTVLRNYGAPVSTCVENLRRFVEAGGKVALGNDYGGGPGTFELGIPMYEIEQMSAAGMTPMQIIEASTRQAAEVLGMQAELGTLEPGKAADLLVVSGDPLADLQALAQVEWVLHGGVVIVAGGE